MAKQPVRAPVVPYDTQGRKLLIQFLAMPERSQMWLAGVLGIAQSSVSLWKRGAARPEPPFREALHELAGIPVGAWETTEDRAKLRAARAGIRREAAKAERATGTEGGR